MSTQVYRNGDVIYVPRALVDPEFPDPHNVSTHIPWRSQRARKAWDLALPLLQDGERMELFNDDGQDYTLHVVKEGRR